MFKIRSLKIKLIIYNTSYLLHIRKRNLLGGVLHNSIERDRMRMPIIPTAWGLSLYNVPFNAYCKSLLFTVCYNSYSII